MKTKFVKAAVWMLAVSLLTLAMSFTVGAAETPAGEFSANWSLSASAQTVTPGGTFTVALVTTQADVYCDGIVGTWDTQIYPVGSTKAAVQMTADGLVINPSIIKTNEDPNYATPNYAYPIIGEFMWVNRILLPVGNFEADFAIVTATYQVAADAPAGDYVIHFTKTVYAGLTDVDETEETLSITVKVQHTCVAGETYAYDANYHWQECAVCHAVIGNKVLHTASTYKSAENGHIGVCVCGSESAVQAHDFTYGDCVCGEKKPVEPVTGLKGDVNLDGLVNSADLTVLARHVGGIEPITNATALANADVNGDSEINSADLTKHARFVGGIITDWSQN